MKFSSLVAVSLVGAVAAQPRARNHSAKHKREVVIDTNTVTVYQTAPVAVVYENEQGDIVFTSPAAPPPAVEVVTAAAATSYAAPSASHKASSKHHSHHKHRHSSKSKATLSSPTPVPYKTPSVPATISEIKPTPSTPTYTRSSSTAHTSLTSAGSGSSGESSGYGVSYSPYNSDGTCRSADDVASDFTNLKGFGYARSYGVDCDQVPSMMQAAKANNMKVMLGVYDIPSCSTELDTMISAVEANGGWDMVHSVAIGNEDVSGGRASVGNVVSAVNSGRAQLRKAGFQGPVVHVDVFETIILNPELCEASDYVAANCHAFFDPNTAALNAGLFVLGQVELLKVACGGKEVHITETGWPNNGEQNGLAIPSHSNQQAALDSIRSAISGNLVFFSAYDNLWKTNNAGTFGTEHYWGIFGSGTSVAGF